VDGESRAYRLARYTPPLTHNDVRWCGIRQFCFGNCLTISKKEDFSTGSITGALKELADSDRLFSLAVEKILLCEKRH
jgi:hypothetical protein